MRALFEKDLRLILTRKSTLFIFLIIGVGFTWSFSSSYSGAYLTMLGTMLALSTISFDDSDNCMAFLFTLPCTRKQYVLEKYIFVYGVSMLAGLIGLMIPLQLKFGPEKSRIVLMLVIGVVLIAGYIISKSAYVSTMIEQVRKLLDGNVPIQLLALLIATLVIITVISVLATSKIMNVKEF